MKHEIFIVGVLAVAPFATTAGVAQSKPTAELRGYWASTAGKVKTVLLFESGRFARRTNRVFDAYLARYEPGRVVLNMHGTNVTMSVAVKDGGLRLTRVGKLKSQMFKKLAAAPADFAPVPTPLGRARKIKRAKMKKIRGELVKRARKDQQARNSSTTSEKKIAAMDESNTAFLEKVVKQHGWIDLARFGEAGADGAWTLVIHSGDIPLLLAARAALAKVPAEMKFRAGQNFATISDRVGMYLGHKQLYGTQFFQNRRGEFEAFAILDLPKIDLRRKKLGMTTFAESLKVQSRWTGGIPKVQTGW